MKRTISLLLVAALLMMVLPLKITVSAEPVTHTDKVLLPDGSYLVYTVTSMRNRSTNRTYGSTDIDYRSKEGTLCWSATLSGSFTYDGKSATCVDASITTKVYRSGWYTASKSAHASGNTAVGYVTMGNSATGEVFPRTITLTCDKNGNRS